MSAVNAVNTAHPGVHFCKMVGEALLESARVLLRGQSLRGLSWRHHGVGMLQAELSETLRVHVHHPSLVAMSWPRNCHDHRFDLVSVVLYGRIYDTRYVVRAFEHESHSSDVFDVWEINHAKVQVGDGRDLRRAGRVVALPEDVRDAFVPAGQVYGIPRRVFHTTRADELTVTLVHRSNFDDQPARVLSASGVPESGIAHKPSSMRDHVDDLTERHRELVAQAEAALR